jgi:hypothetical protein
MNTRIVKVAPIMFTRKHATCDFLGRISVRKSAPQY